MKMLAALIALALPACLLAEDFKLETPALRVAAHENDWQKALAKLKKYGGSIGSEEMPIFGIASVRGPEKGEHKADYFEFMGGDLFYFNAEDWTAQIDPNLARRLIRSKPGLFWKIFGEWPADAASEPRVASLLRRHPELKPVVADRRAALDSAQVSTLLAFLDANPDLFKKYSRLDIYVDQWLLRHEGASLVGCDHSLIIENRKTLDDTLERDPAETGACSPAAVAKHKQVLQYWIDYEPRPSAAPAAPAAPLSPGTGNPLFHNMPRQEKSSIENPLIQKIQFGGVVRCSDGTSCRNATIQRICCDKYGECC